MPDSTGFQATVRLRREYGNRAIALIIVGKDVFMDVCLSPESALDLAVRLKDASLDMIRSDAHPVPAEIRMNPEK